MQKTNSIDMTTGAILPKMIRFALPLMASSLLQLLFNAADVAVVGKFCGEASLAAVSSNGALVNLLINLFIGLATGTNVVAARDFSTKDERALSDTVHPSMSVALIAGMLATLVGIFGARLMLILTQVPDNVLPLATLYLRIYFAGILSTIVYNFGSALLRAIGDTKRPLYYLMFAGVTNVVLNLVFVIVFHLDVAGVALATSISSTLSAILVVRCLMRETGGIRFIPRELRVNRDKLVQIVRIGLPAGIQATLFSVSNVVIQSSINQFGDIMMSGNGAASNIEQFGYMGMSAFYQAILSFSGQCYGRHDYRRVVRVQLVGQLCSAVTGLVFALAVTTLGPQLLWFFTDNPDVVAAGMIRFSCIAPFFLLGGMMDGLSGGLRGIGYSFFPMITSFFGVCLLRLVWVATIFQIPEFHNIQTIYYSYPTTWSICILVNGVIFALLLRRLIKKSKTDGVGA